MRTIYFLWATNGKQNHCGHTEILVVTRDGCQYFGLAIIRDCLEPLTPEGFVSLENVARRLQLSHSHSCFTGPAEIRIIGECEWLWGDSQEPAHLVFCEIPRSNALGKVGDAARLFDASMIADAQAIISPGSVELCFPDGRPLDVTVPLCLHAIHHYQARTQAA